MIRKPLARALRRLAYRLDPPRTVSVRLTADTTAFREALARATTTADVCASCNADEFRYVATPDPCPRCEQVEALRQEVDACLCEMDSAPCLRCERFGVSDYDRGGWLPSGPTMAVNNTGKHEPVGRPHRPDGGIR